MLNIGGELRSTMYRISRRLTCYEDILVWCADELHSLLSEQSHVFVNRIIGDILVCTIVEGDEDVEEDCHTLAFPLGLCSMIKD